MHVINKDMMDWSRRIHVEAVFPTYLMLVQDDDFRARARQAFDSTGLDFVYPYGSTISVQKPAVPILSSGKIAYPMNRPLGEFL